MLAMATLAAIMLRCFASEEEPLFKATVEMADSLPYFLGSSAGNPPPCSSPTSCPVTLGDDIDGAVTLTLELLKPVPPACMSANLLDSLLRKDDNELSSTCPNGTELFSDFCKCPKDKYGEAPKPCSEDPDGKCLETGITDELDATKQLFTVFPSDCLACKCAPTSNYNAVGMPAVYPTSCNGDGDMGLAVSFKLEGPNAGSVKYSPEVARWKPGSPAGTKVTVTFTTTEAFGATDLTMLRIGQATSLTTRQALVGGVADFTELAFVGPARSTGTEQCRQNGHYGTHTTTFDGKYWHYFDGNSRNFTRTTRYKSTTRDFVIQNQFRGDPAVTCALAGREGNDRVMINNCDGSGVKVETDFQTTKVSDQPRIDISGNTYTVHFKSGAWMRAVSTGISSVLYIYFESVDPHASAGMCGNYNGNPNDDAVAYRVLTAASDCPLSGFRTTDDGSRGDSCGGYDTLYESQKVSSKAYPTDTPCKGGPNSGLSPSCDIWEYTPPPPLPPLPPPPPLISDPLVVTCPPGSYILPHSSSPSGFNECRWCEPGVTFQPDPATNTCTTCRAVSPPCDLETHFEEAAPTASTDRRCQPWCIMPTATSRTTANSDAIQDTLNDLQEQQDEFKEQFDAAGADVADGGCGNDASAGGLSEICVSKIILEEQVEVLTARLSTAQNALASSTRDNDGGGAEDDVHDPDCQCRSKQTLVTVLPIVGVLLLVAGIVGFVFWKRKDGSSAPTMQNSRARNRPSQQRRQGRQGGGPPAAPSAALPANNVQREPYGAGGMPAVYGNDSYEPIIVNVAAGDGDSGNC
eukprot:gene16127-25661_t